MDNKDVIAVLEQRVHELEYHAYHRLPEFGLDQLIWFDDKGCTRKTKHNDPRIKYGPDPDHMVPISIEIPPRVLAAEIDRRELRKILHGKEKRLLFRFIENNYDLLMDHWNQKINDKILMIRLQARRIEQKKHMTDDDSNEIKDIIDSIVDDDEDDEEDE